MLKRNRFITNSSNTSFVGFGVYLDERVPYDLESKLYEVAHLYYEPQGGIYASIGFPKIDIDKDGILRMISPTHELQEKYLALRKVLDDAGITEEIGYIQARVIKTQG